MKKKLIYILPILVMLAACGNDDRTWDELSLEEQIEQLEKFSSSNDMAEDRSDYVLDEQSKMLEATALMYQELLELNMTYYSEFREWANRQDLLELRILDGISEENANEVFEWSFTVQPNNSYNYRLVVRVISEPTWDENYVYSLAEDSSYAWLKIPRTVVTVGDLYRWSEENGLALEEVRAMNSGLVNTTQQEFIDADRTGDLDAIIDHDAQPKLLILSTETHTTVRVIPE